MEDRTRRVWVITVGGGYGNYMTTGTEQEVEEKRSAKARWEQTIARKRLADDEELRTGIINPCKNHPNFNTKSRYHCECPKCLLIKRRVKIEKIKKKTK